MFKNYWKGIFIVYILMLVNFIVLKFTGDMNSVLMTIQNNMDRRAQGEMAVNFIPFRTIGGYISDLQYGISFLNIFGNIIPFIPMGFFLPMAFPSLRNGLKTMMMCFLLICSIEILQVITFLGSFDIDDIILNLVSSFIGWMVFVMWKSVSKAALPTIRKEQS